MTNDNFNIILGKKIREIRKLHDFSLNHLAKKMLVSYQQLQKYETGTNRISAEKLYEIAQIMGVEVKSFFPQPIAEQSPILTPEQRVLLAMRKVERHDTKNYIAEIVERIASM